MAFSLIHIYIYIYISDNDPFAKVCNQTGQFPSTKGGPGLMNFFDPEESILAALVLVGVSLFPDSGIDFWGSQKSQKKHPINMIPWKKAFCYSSFLQPMIGSEKEFY